MFQATVHRGNKAIELLVTLAREGRWVSNTMAAGRSETQMGQTMQANVSFNRQEKQQL